MNDSIGKLPQNKTVKEDLVEILRIASDKRGHIMRDDCIDWLELKMKAIRIMAKRGLAKIKK